MSLEITELEFEEIPRRIARLDDVLPIYRGCYEPDPDGGGYRWTRAAEAEHDRFVARVQALRQDQTIAVEKRQARQARREQQLIESEIARELRTAGVDPEDAVMLTALVRQRMRFVVEAVDDDLVVRVAAEDGGADLDFAVASFLTSEDGARYAPRPKCRSEGPLLAAMRGLWAH